MASILLLSERGRTLPIAGRLKNEGHLVKVWIQQAPEEVLKGSRNPSRVQNPTKLLEQFDLILSEPTLGVQAEAIQSSGKQVLGSNMVIDKLVRDKQYQIKVLEFLLGKQEPLVGLSVRLSGFMGPEGFNSLFMLSLPCYGFMDRDKGLRTEGMGSLVVFLNEGDKLTKILLPFEAYLQKAKYQGIFNASLSIKGDLWNIAFMDTYLVPEDILAGAEMLKTSLFDFLFGLLDGKEGKAWPGLGLSVGLSVPPWPYIGSPVTGEYLTIPGPAEKHVSLSHLYLGCLGVVTSKGQDVREARRRVYRTVENSVTSPMVQYREDIGIGAEKDLATLREWGWL